MRQLVGGTGSLQILREELFHRNWRERGKKKVGQQKPRPPKKDVRKKERVTWLEDNTWIMGREKEKNCDWRTGVKVAEKGRKTLIKKRHTTKIFGSRMIGVGIDGGEGDAQATVDR